MDDLTTVSELQSRLVNQEDLALIETLSAQGVTGSCVKGDLAAWKDNGGGLVPMK